MSFIVFDLEWNQCPGGKKNSDSRLPFEIIEIGAVRLNDALEPENHFQRRIKPQVYNWIHDSIHEVIHVNYKDLMKGTKFPQAVQEFLDWCGPDPVFFTWGNQDVMELQRNLKYYGMLSMIPGPVTYYDVQKLFSIRYEDGISRRSLEYAIDYFKIQKNHGFHRALADAFYTGKVLKNIEKEYIFPNSSIDVYQNPKSRKEEIYISYPTYTKYISRQFPDKERTMRDKEVNSTRCPICGLPARRKMRWFLNNSRIYESVSVCQEHGYIRGKIRIRKTEENKYFAIKTLKNVSEEEAEELREKRESLRRKRHMKVKR